MNLYRDKRPIMKPIHPAHHTLKEYRMSCDIDSVCYYADGEYTRCAIVLDVGFLLSFSPREDFSTSIAL